MMSSIRTPGSIWAKCIEQASADAKKPDGRGDGVVYFVGSRSSGKSTLLNRFLYPTRVEPPKPSEGLEYTYARKPSAFDHEKKDMAHIWEIGGSTEFALEIVQGDQVFLTAKQVTTAVVVIVVDLSDPASVLPTALYWLDQVKKKLASTYEKFEKKGLQLPEQLRTRAKSKLYSNNDDKDLVYHSGISLVIAATKYDAFRDADPEVKKVVARTLRFVAHANGAFLTYVGGLHSTSEGAGKDGPAERALLDNFTRLMNHLIFTGLEKKPSLKMPPAFDHQSPLMVPAGTDKFKDIGRPRGGGADLDNIPGGLAEWRELFEKMFPPKEKEKAKGPMIIDERYKDDEIDAVRSRKLQELDNLRKEAEMAKEHAKKKAALAKAQAAAGGGGGGGASSNDTPEKAEKTAKASSKSSKGSAKVDTSAAAAAAAAAAAEPEVVSPRPAAKAAPAVKSAPSKSAAAEAANVAAAASAQRMSGDGGGGDGAAAPKPKRTSKPKTAAVAASPQAVAAA